MFLLKANPKVKKAAPTRKLTRKEAKAIDEAKKRAQPKKKGISAQETIPYERIYHDGIMSLGNGDYSKTIRFEDITYQLANPDDKAAIFGGWCGFLNYFDPSIAFQLSFFNRRTHKSEFDGTYSIEMRNDTDDEIREEYGSYITSQIAKGDNGKGELLGNKLPSFLFQPPPHF